MAAILGVERSQTAGIPGGVIGVLLLRQAVAACINSAFVTSAAKAGLAVAQAHRVTGQGGAICSFRVSY
jgi:hypothetical protein